MNYSKITNKNEAITCWLYCILLMMLLLFSVGGITRLTYSGLSMTDWKPITGILLPLNEFEWEKSFKAYQQFPEFKELFFQMTLSQYKSIYFWEYLHRILARLVGLVFLIPFLFLWWKKKIPLGYHKKLLLGFILGGFQGLIGWIMVKTGLQENPHISHFALSLHFCFALGLFSYLFWILLSLQKIPNSVKYFFKSISIFRFMFLLLMFSVGIQIIYGTFTAGLKAGLIFNTYPLMGGHFFTDALWYYDTFLQNLFLNPVMVQWVHRWLGTFIFIGTVVFMLWSRIIYRESKYRFSSLFLIIFVQFILGILTLIYRVPIILGALHQCTAVLLWSAFVYYLHIFFTEDNEK